MKSVWPKTKKRESADNYIEKEEEQDENWESKKKGNANGNLAEIVNRSGRRQIASFYGNLDFMSL